MPADHMSKLRVHAFAVSLDLYGAGEHQALDAPLGANGTALMQWFFPTRTFCRMHGQPGGSTGIDDEIAAKGFADIGAWIIGRNMFGPIRGPWPDLAWTGWWGEDPPFRVPVFVLTHHPRPSLPMRGGTVFHFITGGMHEALRLAREAAGGKGIRLGGGVATLRQYLAAGLIDEMHFAMAPVLLGRGENLFQGLDLPELGYECSGTVAGEGATHVTIQRKAVLF
jgi:dihydrofolate reductase